MKKKTELKDVKKLSAEEIGLEVARLRERIFTLRTQSVTEKVEDNTQYRTLRRDVARLMTERSARRIAAAPAR